MTEPTSLSEHQTQLQATLIETLRDTWPLQKGLDALLFQNDLFYRLKHLEDIAERGTSESGSNGFLPSEWGTFTAGREDYVRVWNSIDAACGAEDWTFVDSTEDLVVAWCVDMIPERISFFEAALETGSLDEAWMEKAELLREAHAPSATVNEEVAESDSSTNEDTEAEKTETVAVAEKQLEVSQSEIITLRPKSHPTRRRHDRPFTPTRAKPRVRNTRRHK